MGSLVQGLRRGIRLGFRVRDESEYTVFAQRLVSSALWHDTVEVSGYKLSTRASRLQGLKLQGLGVWA